MFSQLLSGIGGASSADARANAARERGRLMRHQAYRTAGQMRKSHQHNLALARLVEHSSNLEGGTSADVHWQNASELEREAADMERYGDNAFRLAMMEADSEKQAGLFSALGGFAGALGSGMSMGAAKTNINLKLKVYTDKKT